MSVIYVTVDSDTSYNLAGVRGEKDVQVYAFVGKYVSDKKVAEVRIRKGEDGKFRVEAWFNRNDAEVTIY